MTNMFNIKPTLVLAAITTIIAALLVTAQINLKPDESVLSGSLLDKCIEMMGRGEFQIVQDWLEAGYAIEKPDGIDKLIRKDDGTIAFQVTADGYAKDGLTMLVVMNADGSIGNISILSMSETPGLGTKVDDEEFLKKFLGAADSVSIVKSTPKKDNEIQAITGATYSSKGVANGINLAQSTYMEMG